MGQVRKRTDCWSEGDIWTCPSTGRIMAHWHLATWADARVAASRKLDSIASGAFTLMW